MNTGAERRATSRLRLRRIAEADAATVAAIQRDPRTNGHRPGGPPSAADAEQDVRGFLSTWQEHGIGYWVVEFQASIVGVAGVRPFAFRGRDCWNLYYRFSPEVWGVGLAVEAAREAVAVAAEQPPARPVVARTRPSNQGAIRVAQNAGLTRRPELDGDGFIVLARQW